MNRRSIYIGSYCAITIIEMFPYSERRDKISTGSSALTALEHTLDTVKIKLKWLLKQIDPF